MGYMQPGTGGIMRETRPAPAPPQRKVRGLGDLVHYALKAVGIEKAVKKVAGERDCGCARRREALNRAVPIGKPDGS